MARFGLLAFLAAAVAAASAAAVDEQVLFPGVPSDKKWDWKDCGKLFPVRSSLPGLPYVSHYKARTRTSCTLRASPCLLTRRSVARTSR